MCRGKRKKKEKKTRRDDVFPTLTRNERPAQDGGETSLEGLSRLPSSEGHLSLRARRAEGDQNLPSHHTSRDFFLFFLTLPSAPPKFPRGKKKEMSGKTLPATSGTHPPRD